MCLLTETLGKEELSRFVSGIEANLNEHTCALYLQLLAKLCDAQLPTRFDVLQALKDSCIVQHSLDLLSRQMECCYKQSHTSGNTMRCEEPQVARTIESIVNFLNTLLTLQHSTKDTEAMVSFEQFASTFWLSLDYDYDSCLLHKFFKSYLSLCQSPQQLTQYKAFFASCLARTESASRPLLSNMLLELLLKINSLDNRLTTRTVRARS